MYVKHLCLSGGSVSSSILVAHTTQDKFYVTTLLDGDYLTVARVRGAQQIRCTPNFEEDHLNSFFPVVEDWHAKVCFMEVSY